MYEWTGPEQARRETARLAHEVAQRASDLLLQHAPLDGDPELRAAAEAWRAARALEQSELEHALTYPGLAEEPATA